MDKEKQEKEFGEYEKDEVVNKDVKVYDDELSVGIKADGKGDDEEDEQKPVRR